MSPVKRILRNRYGAAKRFYSRGDALVLAIFETESGNRRRKATAPVSKQRAWAR